MSENTNMDTKESPNATSAVMEFKLPKSEIDMQLKVGELGRMSIPVEVIAESAESYTMRKRGSVKAEGTFHKESLGEMRERMVKGQIEEGVEE